MIKTTNVKMIEINDWNKLVSDTYKKPYDFQQQDGCKPRGIFNFTVPSNWTEASEDEMNDYIPETINGDVMGVKFKKWLERDPQQPVNGRTDYSIDLWWKRNFYPNIYTVANDLHKKGLLEVGNYIINIDW